MKLTVKQQAFADYYIQYGNATQAYIEAGYKATTKGIAEVEGHKLLKNPKVAGYIEEKLQELSSSRIADAQEVLEYLTAVMRREMKETVVVTLSEEVSAYVPDDEGKMRKQTIKQERPELVEIPAKLSDANKAAELLGKRYALFTDKVDLMANMGVTIIDDLPEDVDDG